MSRLVDHRQLDFLDFAIIEKPYQFLCFYVAKYNLLSFQLNRANLGKSTHNGYIYKRPMSPTIRIQSNHKLEMVNSKRQWKPFEDSILLEQVRALKVDQDGKCDAREARQRWLLLVEVKKQSDDNNNRAMDKSSPVLPLLDEWSYTEGDTLETNPVTFSTQFIAKTLANEYFELGDPLDAAIRRASEKSGKNLKIADNFLNSIIIGCLIIGFFSQTGVVPFFGHVFGNEYTYFPPDITISTSTSTGSDSNNKEKSRMSQYRKRLMAQDTDISRYIEEGSEDDKMFDKLASQLEELDRELGLAPLSLDGLLDEDELDEDGHDGIQEFSDKLDEHGVEGVLF
eukprot:gene8086-16592_t